jgi:1-acyl-sn-glycerol-3-phosphate acyltransferase
MIETPTPDTRKKVYANADYRGLDRMRWHHLAFTGLIWAAAGLLTRFRIRGAENVPYSGPLVVVANHMHNADPLLLLIAFPRYINYMAKEQLFTNRLLATFMHWARVFPVVKSGSIGSQRSAIRTAKSLLHDGLVLGMFPEGQRSQSGKMIEGQPGPIFLAMEMDAPMVPVGITGTEKLKGWGWVSRPRVTINIGKPFHLPGYGPGERKEKLPLMAHMTMEHIAALLPTEYHGIYAKTLDTHN